MKKLFKKIKKSFGFRHSDFGFSKAFTLIEVMIASGLFVVVMILGVTAILNSNNLHKKSQNQRELLDTVYFILEDMTRNLRTGYDYHCDVSNGILDVPLSCTDSNLSIAFEPFNGDNLVSGDEIVYAFDEDNNLFKGTASEYSVGLFNLTKLNPDGLTFDLAKSGFTVFGAEGGPGDILQLQPRVLIRLA